MKIVPKQLFGPRKLRKPWKISIVLGSDPNAGHLPGVPEEVLSALRQLHPELEKLYCQDNGRPALEPTLLAGVTILQFMEKAPDRKAVEQVKLNLGWKYALDLEWEDTGFHPTSLVVFRERLVEGKAERNRPGCSPEKTGGQRAGAQALQAADRLHARLGQCREDKSAGGHAGDDAVVFGRTAQAKAGGPARGLAELDRTLLRDGRRDMETEAFKGEVKNRNAIEWTISELVRGYGLRKTRYRGLAKTRLANYFIAAACNVRRWAHQIAWQAEVAEAEAA